MMKREKIIATLNNMPEELTLDEVLDSIILLEKIEKGLEQSKKGQVIPEEQLDEILPEWLK